MSVEVVGTANIKDKARIVELDKQLRDDKDPMNFIVFGYEADGSDVITVEESGEG